MCRDNTSGSSARLPGTGPRGVARLGHAGVFLSDVFSRRCRHPHVSLTVSGDEAVSASCHTTPRRVHDFCAAILFISRILDSWVFNAWRRHVEDLISRSTSNHCIGLLYPSLNICYLNFNQSAYLK
jgi:uncharacterized PurR-regulated membrane protein YhhQ (DUF165 family)